MESFSLLFPKLMDLLLLFVYCVEVFATLRKKKDSFWLDRRKPLKMLPDRTVISRTKSRWWKSTVRAIPETRAPFEENTWGMQAMPVATEAESANQSVTICGCGSDAIDFMFAAIPSLPRAKEPQVWCSMLWRLQQSQPWGRSIELLENMENHAAWGRCCGNSVCEFWLLNPLVFVSFQAHICLQVCGRPLSCGNHTCEDRTVSSFFHSYKLCRDCGSSYHWF